MEKQLPRERSLAELYKDLTDLEPKPIGAYVPSDAKEQQALFLSGEIRNPKHNYSNLAEMDFTARLTAIDAVGAAIVKSAELNPKFLSAYDAFIKDYRDKTRFMELANLYNQANDAERHQISKEYMQLNIELYGEPDETTYRSLLQEQLLDISNKNLTEDEDKIRQELFALVDFKPESEVLERFKPSVETIEWMNRVCNELYGQMLAHIPDQKVFSEIEVQQVFNTIIEEEFGEAAAGWEAVVEPAKSINVKAAEKRIVIPDDRGEISHSKMQKLVIHELGVHMLRSITGGDNDLELLKNGLNNYYNSEEGLGVIMEQALDLKFREAGKNPYIIAGLACYEGKDFRDIFEIMWRLSALGAVKEGSPMDNQQTEKSKKSAYSGTMRILRGTDELPWFKDLAYYNGATEMWKHLEEILGDYVMLMFLLFGKANPASIADRRLMLETSSK